MTDKLKRRLELKPGQRKHGILGVVVLYKCPPGQAPAIETLERSWSSYGKGGLELCLMVYDNSPLMQRTKKSFPFAVKYLHDAANSGLAAAYNKALSTDLGNGPQWLLLLDQDTRLPDDFWEHVAAALNAIGGEERVKAVVPRVSHQGHPVSPARFSGLGRIRPIPSPSTGMCLSRITAINSGTLVRKSFVEGLGGFDGRFRLDYLDHWLFAEIGRSLGYSYVSGAEVEHDLSIYGPSPRLSSERYRMLLAAEQRFYGRYMGLLANLWHVLSLAVRSFRQLASGQRANGRCTLEHLIKVVGRNWEIA